ncbi:MAG: hypothetical protein HY577_01670 [Candidatus Nealsonbacteria bacterium]|nr:hypothetical protein [Candidatus Nealsonbacteria bacterium]
MELALVYIVTNIVLAIAQNISDRHTVGKWTSARENVGILVAGVPLLGATIVEAIAPNSVTFGAQRKILGC